MLFLSQEDWGNRLSYQPELLALFQSPGWAASTWLHSCFSVIRLDSDISLGYWTSYICGLGAGNFASLLQYGTRLFSSTECIWLLAVMQVVSLKLHPSFIYFRLDPYMFIAGTWTLHFQLFFYSCLFVSTYKSNLNGAVGCLMVQSLCHYLISLGNIQQMQIKARASESEAFNSDVKLWFW